MQVQQISAALGAEVRGLKLGEVDAARAQQLEALLAEHQVLFFPEQHPSVEAHINFGRRFGELEGRHPHIGGAPREEIFELRASAGGIADEWHSDLSFQKHPALYSILHMVECPALGGETLWANLAQVFAELSQPMQTLCEGLSAIHNAAPHGRPEVMAAHPLVRKHPVSGRKVLFANEHFTRRIVELSAGESEALLSYLFAFAAQPRFHVRYRWHKGAVAMWDNRCTQHKVMNDFEGERIIRRVTVTGDTPEGAPAKWPPHQRSSAHGGASGFDRVLHNWLRKQEGAAQ